MITHIHPLTTGYPHKYPYFTVRVAAGFPSPADDYIEKRIDLNEQLIEHPSSTFFVKVTGESMVGAGILSGDTLIVDRSLRAMHGDIVLAVLCGEFTVKRLIKRDNQVFLAAENPSFKPITIKDPDEFEIWGVVIHVIHSYRH